MILYSLEDKDGNLFNLNDSGKTNPAKGSLTFGTDAFSFDVDVIPNTFLPGNVKIGIPRLEGRNIEFTLIRAEQDADDYKQYVNELLQALDSVKYLIDVTNDRRMLVTTQDYNISHDPGGLYQSGNEGFVLNCLNPYWEENTAQEVNQSILANDVYELAFTNAGYLDLYAIFEIEVATLCSFLQITIGNQVIRVQDTIFGATNFELMTIDNENGFVLISNLDRTKNIVQGTGFISIPVGSQIIELFAAQNADVTITYRRRYYV